MPAVLVSKHGAERYTHTHPRAAEDSGFVTQRAVQVRTSRFQCELLSSVANTQPSSLVEPAVVTACLPPFLCHCTLRRRRWSVPSAAAIWPILSAHRAVCVRLLNLLSPNEREDEVTIIR